VSETAASREILAPYCVGLGLDLGFGGDAVVPTALTFDMPRPYTNVGGDRQILRGDCRNLSFLCDESLDYLYSSHLLEDWTYHDLATIILPEWRRVLKTGGLLITNCPDQQRFLAHCERTGQGLNLAHKEPDFSLHTFKHNALYLVGPWETVFEQAEHGAYSWLLTVRKV
jgi:ubiquinone/menaquinone biosynthesis C-methylase UbiE